MGTVTSLTGHPLPLKEGEPNDKIVASLEMLLQQAKDGQILAFAYCLHSRSDRTGHGWITGAFAFHLAAAVLSLQHAFCRMLLEGAEDRDIGAGTPPNETS